MFYFWERERERESMNGGRAGRKRERQKIQRELCSALTADSRMGGLELTNHEIMTWAEVGRLIDWATQAPLIPLLNSHLKISTLQDEPYDSFFSVFSPIDICLISLISQDSTPPLIHKGYTQRPSQWMPEAVGGAKPYIYYILPMHTWYIV